MLRDPRVFYPQGWEPTDTFNFRPLYVEQKELTDGAPRVGDTWYRYEDKRYASSLDEFERPSGLASVVVELRTYEVQRVTPKGVWLGGLFMAPRFVRLSAHKRFAHPSKEAAMASFMARKERQSALLRTQLEYVRRAVAAAKQVAAGAPASLLR